MFSNVYDSLYACTRMWLYRYRGPRRLTVSLLRLYKCAKLIGNAFLVRENRGKMLGACLRGYWDGVFGLMHKRF